MRPATTTVDVTLHMPRELFEAAPETENRATPGMEPFALLAFAVQRIARAVKQLPGANAELLRKADADAMLVLEAAGVTLPPEMQAVADARRQERRGR